MTAFLGGVLLVGVVKADNKLAAELTKRCDSAKNVASSAHAGPEWAKKFLESRELYFYGAHCTNSNEDKKTFHWQGHEAGKRAVELLTGGNSTSDTPINPAHTKELARAHYYAAINLSRWGQAEGILTALGRWDDVKIHLNAAMKNDAEIFDYGIHRTFGRAYMKLPFFKGGSNKKSKKYLAEAYKKTFNKKFATSGNTLTTLYYLDVLSKLNQTDEFCTVYSGFAGVLSFDRAKAKELNPQREMETLLDIQKFKNSKEDWIKEIKDKADIDC